jgi:predicted ATPase
MKLDYLKIDKFKNLRDFSIDFDQGSQSTVLVGRNGSGKSNLLEALILIFRDLDLGEPPQFGYELGYFCRNYQVKIIAKPDNPKERIKVYIKDITKPVIQNSLLNAEEDGFEEISFSKFRQDAREKYLPRYVFGYYSGPSNRMEKHFEKHQERFYNELINKKDGDESKPLRPLLYARLVHSQFVLLAFFTDKDSQIQKFLDEYLWIEGLDSVLFVMRQPPWNSKEGDPRFWYARGEVRNFLSRLYSLSSAPLRLKWKVPVSFRKFTTLEHLYLYLKDPEALEELARGYVNQQEFFKALESTYISELLSEVRIRVKVRKSDGSITFREMSEGEQQLLMVLGLLRFTKEDESLFLLDEPDTHLNPAWSLQYIDFLRQVVGNQETSHIIMTTHDPLTIAGLERKQVQIIQRDESNGAILAIHPEEDPRGMGVAALLTSDIYGLRSQLDLETMRLLDERRELASMKELSDQQRARLAELNKQLEGLDFSISVRDPLYQVFVKEMTLRQQSDVTKSATLTPDQFQAQKELALKIIDEITAVGEDKHDLD